MTVSYATLDGSAHGGVDYIATNGSLTFSPSVSTQFVTVLVKGDTLIESDETFFVSLNSPSNAVIGAGQGTGTIINDDGLPGRVDHFAWNTVPSPQALKVPFGVTITAQDVFNATVTNFTGAVALSASQGGASKTNTILGDVTANNNSAGDFTLGYSFTPNTNILVTHVRHYSGTKVSIWTDAGALPQAY